MELTTMMYNLIINNSSTILFQKCIAQYQNNRDD